MGKVIRCDECSKVYRSLQALEDLRENDGICLVCNDPIEVEDWDRVLASYEDDDFDDPDAEAEDEDDFSEDEDDEDFDDDDDDFGEDFGEMDDDSPVEDLDDDDEDRDFMDEED